MAGKRRPAAPRADGFSARRDGINQRLRPSSLPRNPPAHGKIMKKDSREKSARKKSNSANKVNRRAFVKLLPAAGATAMAATRLEVAAATAQQPQQQPQPPQRVTKEI